MCRITSTILGYRLSATNGELGHVKDFYFDDNTWTIRYLVVDTGGWLSGRKVLISPQSLGEPDWDAHSVPVFLTKEQVERSPSIESDAPVSRQHEEKLAAYYDWPTYWDQVILPGGGMMPPAIIPREHPEDHPKPTPKPRGDPNLRSVNEVVGYHIDSQIDADESRIGYVEDFIAETDNWAIRYMMVATGHWFPGLSGKRTLIAPAWIAGVSWKDHQVWVNLTPDEVKNSPEYDPATPINRELETKLYDYYRRPKYWQRRVDTPTTRQSADTRGPTTAG